MARIILLLIVALLSFLLTYIYLIRAPKSFLDLPNERSSHLIPTPRGGGVAIVISFYSALFYSYVTGQIENKLFFALIPGIGIAIVGFYDDYRTLSATNRLGAQFLFSILALFFLNGFNGFFGDNLNWLWSIAALFGFVWFINLFNFLDGSDGYASMEAISISLTLWFFTGTNLLLLLAFSVGGFLFWNWPKAKIFMGDAGSTTLGFIIVVFGIHFHNNDLFNFSYWLILTSLFWFDATYTLIHRIINHEKLSQAHKNHIYQRAIRGGHSHLTVMISGFAINIILFIICFLIIKNIISLITGLLITIAILWVIMKYVDYKFAYDNQKGQKKLLNSD
jgi:UDP-N-acetylmuramyl pentapeptide phosphotransferase/UDP-N-acetylglucosamine-1-phosphate transferase